jgi:hypothetical protein
MSRIRRGETFTNYQYVIMRHNSSKDTFLLQPYLNGIRGGGDELSAYKTRRLIKDWLATNMSDCQMLA